MKGQNKEAIQSIQVEVYQHLGNVFAGSSDYKEAIKYYKKAREISPNARANEMEVTAYLAREFQNSCGTKSRI